MQKLLNLLVLLSLSAGLWAQNAQDLHQQGTAFMRNGDYANAIIVLKAAREQAPGNTEILNDLGVAYFMAGQYQTGYELMVPVAESEQSNDQSFVIAAMNLRGGKNNEEAEQVYRMGLRRFPNSGALYADYGDFLQNRPPGKDGIDLSIMHWERGIEVDPAYPLNYYHAANYYNKFNNNFWAAIYGEIFINLENFTTRTVEMKNLVFDCYKKLYAFELATGKSNSEFESGTKQTLYALRGLVSGGITPEILTALRTRFILDWNNNGGNLRYPFALFNYQKYLLEEGLFDAYNQWLFGSVANIPAFQNWTRLNADQYSAFNQDRLTNHFFVGTNQYYRGKL